jgi:oligoendopeptidase F
MFDSLPTDAGSVRDWSWSEFERYYAALIKRPLYDDTVAEFLGDWTRMSELLDETFSKLHVAITVNTADAEAEKQYHTFLETIYPPSEEADQRLKTKLLSFGVVPDGFELALRKMRTEAEIFREENLPLLIQEHKLTNEYDKTVGAQTVEWEGRELTVAQLRPYFQNVDRTVRQKAWQVATERQLKDREVINKLWIDFLTVRRELASNAGFGDYRSFRWKQMLRFDYTPADCSRFHEAIEKAVLPAALRICQKRKDLLGVPSLRPWDMDVDPLGRPPLAPFQEVEELRAGASRIFHRLDPILGEYFDVMVQEGLLDLENRKNKAPGGYCTEFAASKRPFIFMNAVGVHNDVQTLLHESGHSFHAFERYNLPYMQQRQVGMEFSEVASMGMELLASPYLARSEGGFYSKEDATRALVEHLEFAVLFWPYMAMVDAFQHWVYENPHDAEDSSLCDTEWARLSQRFMPWLDWSGLEDALVTGWHRKLHIHVAPLYYVEYGLAQLGAVQIWKNAMKDPQTALKAYRHALSLGGTASLPELFRQAGATFAFDAKILGDAVSLIEQVIEEQTKDDR